MRLAFWQDSIAAWVVGALGSLGIFLAAVGLYGIISHRVGQRRHELGIRMALGAAAPDVMRMVLVQGLKLASLGTAIGLVVSFGATRFMSSLLYGVRPTDPLAFAASAMIVLLVAF